jgi:Family of unknown function (DUF5706)
MPDSRANVESINAAAPANRYDLPQLTLRLDQAWRILNLNQELIRSADQKSYLLIVMSTLLVTYISTNLPRLMGMGMPVKFSLVLFICSAAAFYYFALSTLFARNRGKAAPSTQTAQIPNLVFFGDIAQRAQPAEYATCFHRADLHEVLDDVCHQIHQVANISTRKYRAYRRAWIALLTELCMFVTLQFWIIL